MPFKKKIEADEPPRKRSMARSEKFARFSRSGKTRTARPKNRNSSPR
jgi:hypothetical protein